MDPMLLEDFQNATHDDQPHLDSALSEDHLDDFEEEIELHQWFGGD